MLFFLIAVVGDDGAQFIVLGCVNTLVLTKQAYPLPLLRSESLLEKAGELARVDDRSEEQEVQLANHLTAIRNQLEMGEILGYGDRRTYKDLHAKLDRIEKNIEAGKSGERFFDDAEQLMAKLWE